MEIKKGTFNNRPNITTAGLLILIVGLSIFLRFYEIGKLSFWLDEILTASCARGSISNLIQTVKNDANMSLYFLLVFLENQIFPNVSDGMQRSLSAVFSVASIPVVFLLGKNLEADAKKGSVIGLVAAFLIAVNAYHIEYAQEFRSYSLTFLLTASSTLLLIKILENEDTKTIWLILYTVISAASFYSHLHALFIIVAQAVTLPLLLVDKKKYGLKLKQILYCLIGIILLILPIALIAINKGPGPINWIWKPAFVDVLYLYLNISGYHGLSLLILYIAFGCFGILAGTRYPSRRDLLTRWKYSLLVSCLLLPVILTFIISNIIVPIFIDRYLLYTMPYLVLLAVSGIIALANLAGKDGKHSFSFISIVMITVALFSVFAGLGVKNYYKNHQKEDWRNATEFLSTKCSQSLRVYYPNFIKKCVLYYNPTLMPVENEKLTNYLQQESVPGKSIFSVSNGYDQACLVLSHAEIGERAVEADNIRAALQSKYPNFSLEEFAGVIIEIYQK